MFRPRLVTLSSQEVFKENVERELAAFEEREKKFQARDRKERLVELLGFMPDLENNQPADVHPR